MIGASPYSRDITPKCLFEIKMKSVFSLRNRIWSS